MTNSEMKKMLIKTSIFTFISIGIMMQRAATKHIVISDAAAVPVEHTAVSETYNLHINTDVTAKQSGKLIIPLSRSVSSDNIVLEDRYMDHELHIYIDCRDEGFYQGNPVTTDLDIIESATCITEQDSGSVCLDFKLDSLYANESTLTENGTIEVKFFKPSEVYDRIVVVDPEAGGSESGVSFEGLSEKSAALDIALDLKNISEKDTENQIRFYYTRLSDVTVSDEDRMRLLEETGADLYVGIGMQVLQELEQDEASEQVYTYGIQTVFNDEYYLRSLDNASLADLMEQSCVAKTGGNALGMKRAADEDVILKASKHPSVKILAGVVDDKEDNRLLQDSDYKNKLASGIYQGILEAFEEIK